MNDYIYKLHVGLLPNRLHAGSNTLNIMCRCGRENDSASRYNDKTGEVNVQHAAVGLKRESDGRFTAEQQQQQQRRRASLYLFYFLKVAGRREGGVIYSVFTRYKLEGE